MVLLRLDFAAFKWDVRFAATLIMCLLIGLASSSKAATTATQATAENHIQSKPIGDFRLGGSESYFASVDRILRSNYVAFRSHDVRWKQVVSRDAMDSRRMFKRSAVQHLRKREANLNIVASNRTAAMQDIEMQKGIENAMLSNSASSAFDQRKRESGNSTRPRRPLNASTKNQHSKTTESDKTSLNNQVLTTQKTTENKTSPGTVIKADDSVNLSCHEMKRFHPENIPSNTTRHLDLSCNRFSTADQLFLKDLIHLEALDLSHNHLQYIGSNLFNDTTNLTHLTLTDNQLQAISRTDFEKLRHLESLRLGHNELAHVAPDTFGDLVNLQLLDLSYNAIDAGSVRALQGIPALRSLSVAFNTNLGWALQEFVASWSLKELDASGTGLCAIPAALAQSVHTLNVSHNYFEVIRCGDLDSYPLLKYLDLSHNAIVDIEDDALGRLEILVTLQLHDNRITAVPSSLPSSLTHLYLHNNQIADIQPTVFAQLDNLETLDLSGNQITYLPGLPLPRLLTLNLRGSGLRGLSQSVVQTSPELKDLLLEGNPIKCTDLMGIAEWTTACRSEVPIESDSRYATSGQLRIIPAATVCCGRPVVYSPNRPTETTRKQIACKLEATRKPPVASVKPKKRSRKAKMEEIWRSLSLSNFTVTNSTRTNNNNNTSVNENQSATIEISATQLVPLATTNDYVLKNIPNDYDNHDQQQSSDPSPTSNILFYTNKSLLTTTAISMFDKKNNKFKPLSSSSAAAAAAAYPSPKLGQLEINSSSSKPLLPQLAAGAGVPTLTANPKASVTAPHPKLSSLGAVNLVENENEDDDDDDDVDESPHLASDSSTPPGRTTMSKPTQTTTERATAMAKPDPRNGRRRFDNNQRPRTNPNNQHPKPAAADWNTNQANPGDDGVNEVNRPEAVVDGGGREQAPTSNNDNRRLFHRLLSGTMSGELNDNGNVHNRLKEEDAANNIDLLNQVNQADYIGLGKRPTAAADSSRMSSNTEYHPPNDIGNIYVAEQSLVAGLSLNGMPKNKNNGQLETVMAPNMSEELAVVSSTGVIVHSSHHRRHNSRTDSTTEDHNGRPIPGSDGVSNSSGLPEQWNAVRANEGQPGVFIVMGIAIAVFVCLVLVQVYRGVWPWQHQQWRNVDAAGDEDDPIGSTHRDMLPMGLLSGDNHRKTIQYTEAPIELW